MAAITKLSSKNSEILVELSTKPTKLLACSDWSLNTTRNTIDVSTIGTEWKEFLTGQISADGSFSLIYDPKDSTTAKAVEDAMFQGTELMFHLRPEGTGEGKVNFKLAAFVTSYNVSAATEDAIKVSCNFQGTGPIERTQQSAPVGG